MADSSPYVNGEFCWYELSTTDAAKAKPFYTQLFGWEANDNPMPGGGGPYTMFRQNGGDVGGMYQMDGDQMGGMPSHWQYYVWVDDVAAAADKAAALGGKVMVPPMDMPGIGTMAVLQDPGGAIVAVYHGGGHEGSTRQNGEPGAFSWLELMTRDQAGAEKFYGKLFGWGLDSMDMGGGAKYTIFKHGTNQIAGGMQMDDSEQWKGIPPNWTGYITVADTDATAAKAVELGGMVLMAPMDIPDIGRFAVLKDPTGAVVSVIAYVPRS